MAVECDDVVEVLEVVDCAVGVVVLVVDFEVAAARDVTTTATETTTILV